MSYGIVGSDRAQSVKMIVVRKRACAFLSW